MTMNPRIGLHMRAAVVTTLSAFLTLTSIGAVPARSQNHEEKAWFEAKSICLFRLGDGQMPRTPQELSDALLRGWRQSLILPDADNAVAIDGASYPSLNSLKIDLSDGRYRSTKKDRIKVDNKIEQDLRVAHLEVKGDPLILQRAKLHMNLVADGAQLALEHDRQGKPVMMLADAASGRVSFEVSVADAQRLLLHNAREAASKCGVSIEKMELKITPLTPRDLEARLHVLTSVAFVPAGMIFNAHVIVDDQMNAKITGLTVDGDEALGPLIVGFLRPALAKYNNQTRPLVSFPAGNVRLRDVAVRVDDSLHLTAAFGS